MQLTSEIAYYTGDNKPVARYEGYADSYEDAIAAIPGDFLVYYWTWDWKEDSENFYYVEILRTF